MFKFLKDKLKGALSKISKKAEQEAPEETVEEKIESPEERPAPSEAVPEEKPAEAIEAETSSVKEQAEPVKEIGEKPVKLEPVSEPAPEQKPSEPFEERPAPAEAIPGDKTAAKKGFFAKLTQKISTKKIAAAQFDGLFWELELALLENNVAVEVIEKIKTDLKGVLVDQPIPRGKIEETIASSLMNSINDLFKVTSVNLIEKVRQAKAEHRPLVICFVGINGSGKTTTIAKMVQLFQSQGFSCVIAAADTFRAAAIDQLQLHADKLGVKLIRHDYGADAAAVAYDAVQHAKSKGRDVVLVDTAGRLHSNLNLMDEMKKIMRVANPDVKIFVGESITGNDCVEQAKHFDTAIGIDGIILAKADIDEKGGAALSISFVTKKPILYLGTGQDYEDIKSFDPSLVLGSLGLKT